MDPGALFAMIFGSEKFEPLVGELQLGIKTCVLKCVLTYIQLDVYVFIWCIFMYIYAQVLW
jgi:hypothetical protein